MLCRRPCWRSALVVLLARKFLRVCWVGFGFLVQDAALFATHPAAKSPRNCFGSFDNHPKFARLRFVHRSSRQTTALSWPNNIASFSSCNRVLTRRLRLPGNFFFRSFPIVSRFLSAQSLGGSSVCCEIKIIHVQGAVVGLPDGRPKRREIANLCLRHESFCCHGKILTGKLLAGSTLDWCRKQQPDPKPSSSS